jgi:hypothetical protein
VERFGLRPERSVVVGNGVDDVFFAAGDEAIAAGSDWRYDKDRVLVVGGLNGWDGADRVLASADALAGCRSTSSGPSTSPVASRPAGAAARFAASVFGPPQNSPR